jgi:hypothetical protein
VFSILSLQVIAEAQRMTGKYRREDIKKEDGFCTCKRKREGEARHI